MYFTMERKVRTARLFSRTLGFLTWKWTWIFCVVAGMVIGTSWPQSAFAVIALMVCGAFLCVRSRDCLERIEIRFRKMFGTEAPRSSVERNLIKLLVHKKLCELALKWNAANKAVEDFLQRETNIADPLVADVNIARDTYKGLSVAWDAANKEFWEAHELAVLYELTFLTGIFDYIEGARAYDSLGRAVEGPRAHDSISQ